MCTLKSLTVRGKLACGVITILTGRIVSAIVTVTQTFWQGSPMPICQARYVFPVPAHAAVCAFAIRAEGGKTITGVVKEKGLARREHEVAVRQGKLTGLVERVTGDGKYGRSRLRVPTICVS